MYGKKKKEEKRCCNEYGREKINSYIEAGVL